MPDSNLNSSISSLVTKITNDIPTATVDELLQLARAAEQLGQSENVDIETAINTRINQLTTSASASEIQKLGNAIRKMRTTPVNIQVASGTDISDLTDTTGLLNTPTDISDLTDTTGLLNTPSDISELTDTTGLLGSGGGVTTYTDMSALISTTGMNAGDQAFVQSNNNLYIYNGTGWYKIATVENLQPATITGVDAAYALATDGTPTVITAVSTDPEGFPLTWSYQVTSGILGTTATVSQEDNVFTITPGTTDPDDVGEFELTFTVTDGVNGAVNTTSTFTLLFWDGTYKLGSGSSYTWAQGDSSILSTGEAFDYNIRLAQMWTQVDSPYYGPRQDTDNQSTFILNISFDNHHNVNDGFTVEWWVKPNITSYWKQLAGYYGVDDTSSYALHWWATNQSQGAAGTGNTYNYKAYFRPTNSVWTHCTLEHSSTGWKIYMNGSMEWSGSYTSPGATGKLYLGSHLGDFMDLHVTKGVKYGSNFTAPSRGS